MAFMYEKINGDKVYLHHKATELRNGHKQTIYFFTKDIREGALNEVPDGYEVYETRTGLVVLRKIR